MKCHEARNFIGPYLDSELDTKTSLEIEQHLERCAECNRFFAAEQQLDERIQSSLRQGRSTASLWAAAETRIASKAPAQSSHRKPWLLAGVFAAASIVVAGIIAFLPKEKTAPDLAAITEERHHEYASQKVAPEFNAKIPDAVAQKLGDRLDAQAFAFTVQDADFSLRGARVCHIGNVPAAWLLGRYKSVPVSLMIFKQSELGAFGDIKERFQSGETLVDCGKGHCEIIARIVDGNVVCLVAHLPKAVLRHLALSVKPPSAATALLAPPWPELLLRAIATNERMTNHAGR